MGYLKKVGTVIVYIGLFLAVITFLPGLPPDTEFNAYSIGEPDYKVKLQNRLHNAERLYIDEAIGAESFTSYDGKLYTGIFGGYVVRLEEDHIVPIVKLGKDCDGFWQEQKCGKLLGLEFDKNGNLYVMDAYYGIFKINMATKKFKNIVNVSEPIEGKLARISNSLDIAKNGDIYWTDSSTDFYLQDGVYSLLADPSGRLIRYNAATGKNQVLVRKLGFANGIKLSDDESFVIVSETSLKRIIKYHLKGPKAGQHEMFIEGLPGLPDNIHSDGHGGFLVTLFSSTSPDYPQLWISLAPHPYLRKMILRLMALIEAPFKLLQDIYPNIYAERLIYSIGSFSAMNFLYEAQSIVLRIDASGNIIEALVSNDNDLFYKSSAYIHNDYLWLGSPFINYITRVPLKQAFPDLVNSREQSSHTMNKSQSPKATVSDTQSKKVRRDTDSAATKASKLKQEKTSSPSTPKPTTAPTPKPSSAPTTTPKPTAVPKTTPKPTAMPKASTAPEINNKHTSADSNVKSSETKSTPKSSAEIKKDGAKTETNQGTLEGTTKTDAKSGKNTREERDASTKQKSKPEKVKQVETNRPKDTNKK